MERGQTFRAFQWKKAREAAMPKTMPLMVVRMHVRRAHALGLDYPTYASIRKASGRDIMGLLFSSNALRVVKTSEPQMPLPRSAAVSAIEGAQKLALVHRPLHAGQVARANPMLDHVDAAPKFTDSWSDMRDHLGRVITRSQAGFGSGADHRRHRVGARLERRRPRRRISRCRAVFRRWRLRAEPLYFVGL